MGSPDENLYQLLFIHLKLSYLHFHWLLLHAIVQRSNGMGHCQVSCDATDTGELVIIIVQVGPEMSKV